MTSGFDEEIWDQFITKHNIHSEKEDNFLQYLFEQDINPDTSSLEDALKTYESEEL